MNTQEPTTEAMLKLLDDKNQLKELMDKIDALTALIKHCDRTPPRTPLASADVMDYLGVDRNPKT